MRKGHRKGRGIGVMERAWCPLMSRCRGGCRKYGRRKRVGARSDSGRPMHNPRGKYMSEGPLHLSPHLGAVRLHGPTWGCGWLKSIRKTRGGSETAPLWREGVSYLEVPQGTLWLEDGQGDLEMGDLGGDTRACLLL